MFLTRLTLCKVIFLSHFYLCLFDCKTARLSIVPKCPFLWNAFILVYCHRSTASDVFGSLSALWFPNKRNHSRQAHHSFRTEVQFISAVTFALANHRRNPLGLFYCVHSFCIYGLSNNLINSLILIVPIGCLDATSQQFTTVSL